MPNKVAYTSFLFLKERIFQRQSWVALKKPTGKKRSNLYNIFHHDMLNVSDHQSILKAYSSDNLTRKTFIAYFLGKEVFKVIKVLTLCHITLQEFLGNADQNTIVYHALYPAVSARYVRFRPLLWHNHISMRVEVYGCQGTELCYPFQSIFYKEGILFLIEQG